MVFLDELRNYVGKRGAYQRVEALGLMGKKSEMAFSFIRLMRTLRVSDEEARVCSYGGGKKGGRREGVHEKVEKIK